MSYQVTYLKGGLAFVTRAIEVAGLSLLTAATAAAQSPRAQPHCTSVGGAVITNFVGPNATLGPVTGDLRGAISAAVLGVAPGPDGTTVFTVQHQWVTESGDRVDTSVAEATAVQVSPGSFAIVSYPVTISGGTGRFAGATGTLRNIGSVDLTTQRTVFRYEGEVCVQAP